MVFLLHLLLLTASTVTAVENSETEYRLTVFSLDPPFTRSQTNSIRAAVRKNDHRADVYLQPGQNNLTIIHHKSIAVDHLTAIIRAQDVSALKTASQPALQANMGSLPQNMLQIHARTRKPCGATRAVWQKFLGKYFRRPATF